MDKAVFQQSLTQLFVWEPKIDSLKVNNNSCHLLRVYHMPGTVPRTWHRLSH